MKCSSCGEDFNITDRERELRTSLSPVIGGTRFDIPDPDLCPACRQQLRLAFRNERQLYKRKCDLKGHDIVSYYHPNTAVKVYAHESYYEDSWDATEFGRDFDFNRPFFEQLRELWRDTPQLALFTNRDILEYNCPYTNFAGCNKNSYLIFDSDFVEESFFSNVLKHSRHCIDCSYVYRSELCAHCINCTECYGLSFSQDCTGCNSGAFLKNCIGCNDCLFCVNLTRKQYHINNKPYSKEEYEAQVAAMGLGTRSGIAELVAKFENYFTQFPHKYAHVRKVENSTGDYIENSKDCIDCYDVYDGEQLMYCDSLSTGVKTCMDVSSFGEKIERIYNSGTVGINGFNIICSFGTVESCSELLYCHSVWQAESCFGCTGLKRRKHCILNKQYTEEEYNDLAGRIIDHMRSTGEWGRYFAPELSFFGYNETVANEHFPLMESEARAMGFGWLSDGRSSLPQGVGVAPETVAELTPELLKQPFVCEGCSKPYRIISQELGLLTKLGLPPSGLCPHCRHLKRVGMRNPRRLWDRQCSRCEVDVISSYAPARPEPILCESCFQDELA